MVKAQEGDVAGDRWQAFTPERSRRLRHLDILGQDDEVGACGTPCCAPTYRDVVISRFDGVAERTVVVNEDDGLNGGMATGRKALLRLPL